MAKRTTVQKKKDQALWEAFLQKAPTETEFIEIIEDVLAFRMNAAQAVLENNPSMLALAMVLMHVPSFALATVSKLISYPVEQYEKAHLTEHERERGHGGPWARMTHLDLVGSALVSGFENVPNNRKQKYAAWLLNTLSRWNDLWRIFASPITSSLWQSAMDSTTDQAKRESYLKRLTDTTQRNLHLKEIAEPMIKMGIEGIHDNLIWLAEEFPCVRGTVINRLLSGDGILGQNAARVIVAYGSTTQRQIAMIELKRSGIKDGFCEYVLSRAPHLEHEIANWLESEDLSRTVDKILPLVSKERKIKLLQKYKKDDREKLIRQMKGIS